MYQPDFLICLECDSPCYVFEWKGDHGSEAVCEVCGNEDPDLFMTEAQMESLAEEAESAR